MALFLSLGGSTQSDTQAGLCDKNIATTPTGHSSSLGPVGVQGAAANPHAGGARFSSRRPDYERYEREKLAFIKFNPRATPAEYDAAIQAIAKRCGI